MNTRKLPPPAFRSSLLFRQIGAPDVAGSLGHGEDDLIDGGVDAPPPRADVSRRDAGRMEMLHREWLAFGMFRVMIHPLRPQTLPPVAVRIEIDNVSVG